MTNKNEIEQLFRDNYKAMFALAVRILHDADAARDIVHDVFASLLQDNVASATPGYLLQGVRFACLKHIRNLDTRQRLNHFYALDLDEIEEEEWPDDNDIALLNHIIDTLLPENIRETVRLRFNGKKSYKEIAEYLGVSEVTVYKNLRHAMIVLRQNFKLHG